jgi:hypothetical protein
MGLDISYYTNAVLVPDAEVDDDGYPTDDNAVLAYVNPDFTNQADDIQHKGVYRYDDSGAFRAGSYGGYNAWRDQLAELAGFSSALDVWNREAPEGPFVPLINFSDCEGIIGPDTSARLARDFAELQPKVDALSDGYFREKYADWRAAFEAVAGNGFVDFH